MIDSIHSWSDVCFLSSFMLIAIGLGVAMMSWWQVRRLIKLARRYPLMRMRDAKAGDRLRVRGRVVKGKTPRWRDPVHGEPVVLARLVVRNSAKVIVDITRGDRFELEDDTGTRAVIHIDGATLEKTSEPVLLAMPPQEPLRNFVTARGLEIIEEAMGWKNGAMRKLRTRRRGLAALTKICPREEVVVMGVARRDETSPDASGYREAHGTLTLGGKGEVPVRVLQPGLDGVLGRWRGQRRAGYRATALGAALLGAWLLWG